MKKKTTTSKQLKSKKKNREAPLGAKYKALKNMKVQERKQLTEGDWAAMGYSITHDLKKVRKDLKKIQGVTKEVGSIQKITAEVSEALKEVVTGLKEKG